MTGTCLCSRQFIDRIREADNNNNIKKNTDKENCVHLFQEWVRRVEGEGIEALLSFFSYKTHQISHDYIAVSPLKLNLCGNLRAADWNLPIPRQRWKLSLTKMTPRPWSSATKWFSPAEEHGGRLIFCTSIIMFQHDLFFFFFWLRWKAISECAARRLPRQKAFPSWALDVS